jgi:hypothetical protein
LVDGIRTLIDVVIANSTQRNSVLHVASSCKVITKVVIKQKKDFTMIIIQ